MTTLLHLGREQPVPHLWAIPHMICERKQAKGTLP